MSEIAVVQKGYKSYTCFRAFNGQRQAMTNQQAAEFVAVMTDTETRSQGVVKLLANKPLCEAASSGKASGYEVEVVERKSEEDGTVIENRYTLSIARDALKAYIEAARIVNSAVKVVSGERGKRGRTASDIEAATNSDF